MRCGLKVFAKVFHALEFGCCKGRYTSSGSVQERYKRLAVHKWPFCIVRIGFLQARIGPAQSFDVFAIRAYVRLTTLVEGSLTEYILPSAHSHDPTNGSSSFNMFGLGVMVLEVAATDVLVDLEASATVAISTVLTPWSAIAMAVRNVLVIRV